MQQAQPTQPPSRNEAPFPRQFRLRHPRSRSGCLTCRRRKKKCDETPGRCGACRRGGLDCHWPDGISAKEQSSEYGPSETTTMVTMPMTMDLACTERAEPWHLTSASPLLLQHYVIETASRLGATKSSAINPFLGCVLPVAFSDDIMMHTVLAVAGAHMTFEASDTTAIRTSMRQHYGYAVRGVAKGLVKGNVKETRCPGELMLVLALLSHYEVLAGSPVNNLRAHVNALRWLFRYQVYTDDRLQDENQAQNQLALAHEIYSFHALAHSATPASTTAVFSLDEVIVSHRYQYLDPRYCHGGVFGGSQGLFEFIPRVKHLFRQRLAEESVGLAEPSAPLESAIHALRHQIDGWVLRKPSTVPAWPCHNDDYEEWAHQSMAAECLRHALHIYCLSALSGSCLPSTIVKAEILKHANHIFDISIVLEGVPASSNTLWAVLIAGVCLLDDQRRQRLADALLHSSFKMRHLLSWGQFLRLFWTEPSALYGLQGLQAIADKYDILIPII